MPRAAADVTNPDHVPVLMRRVTLPIVVVLLLAQAFFMAGVLDEPLISLPLAAVTLLAVVAITIRDYRAEVEQRDLIQLLQQQRAATEREIKFRHERTMADFAALASGAAETARVPAIVAAELRILTAVVTDLMAARSARQRRRLLAELEVGILRACCDVVEHRSGTARAVLYRRVAQEFEPARAHGRWDDPPVALGARSAAAKPLRLVLRQREPAPSGDDADDDGWFGAHVPLGAGGRALGVLRVERRGPRLDAAEVESLECLAHVMTAGAMAHEAEWVSAPAPPPAAGTTDVHEPLMGELERARRHVVAVVAARLESLVREEDVRRQVRQSVRTGRE